MSERDALLEGIRLAEVAFRKIESLIPPAQWVPWRGQNNWRFVEKLPSQALIQKLARQITSAKTLDLLLSRGFVQEIGATQRMLDEISEDIMFISLGMTLGDWTDNHVKYLEFFWSEDAGMPPVRRKTIRAYNHRATKLTIDPSTADSIGREIYQVFSDFVHARSSTIMPIVVGPPPRFDLNGITDKNALRPLFEQAPSYGLRCLMSACSVTQAVATGSVAQDAYQAVVQFESRFADLIFPDDYRPSPMG